MPKRERKANRSNWRRDNNYTERKLTIGSKRNDDHKVKGRWVKVPKGEQGKSMRKNK